LLYTTPISPALCQLLEDRGYRHVPSGGSWGCNFVLRDNQGDRIDLHSFELDTSGENTFGVAYRAEHLTGVGMIEGYQVRCVAPDWMVKFHTGYPLDKNGQKKMDGGAYSCSVIPLTTDVSDFASKAPEVIPALTLGTILWSWHSAMFPKPEKSFIPNLSNCWTSERRKPISLESVS
jgi:hypothetical protein